MHCCYNCTKPPAEVSWSTLITCCILAEVRMQTASLEAVMSAYRRTKHPDNDTWAMLRTCRISAKLGGT